MPTTNNDESSDIIIISSNITASTSHFSDDEEDHDDEHENPSNSHKISDHVYNNDGDDDDDDILMISEETKTSADVYNTNIIRANFPFDRFHSFINDHTQQMALSYSISINRNKSALLMQIYKQIASTLSGKRSLIVQKLASDSNESINSYSMHKYEKTSDKFQSRLLTIFDEQTIVNGLLCLWLLRDAFQNRLLPSLRIVQTNKSNSIFENNFRDIAPEKLKRSIKRSLIYVLFRLIKDDVRNQVIYIQLLQAMYFFQSELAYIYLYYLSIDVEDMKIAADIFDKFAHDIIKLNRSHRK